MGKRFADRFRKQDDHSEWRRPESGDAEEEPPARPAPRHTALPPETAAGPQEQSRPVRTGPILSADGLIRTYPGRAGVTALKGVSLSLDPGDFVALMGPSGSGKTTFLGVLSGLDAPDAGEVRWKAKRALRRAVLAERDAVPEEERSARSEVIIDRFLGLPETAGAETVLAFWSFGSEVDTRPLIARLRSDGRTVALPRIEGNEVAPVVATPETPMTEASFGAMEPADGRALDVAELDLVVVPGLAFDRSCGRVGYGGGYYDRLLGKRRDGVAAIAIAFALQIVDRVPSGAIDRRIDGVVTEVEVIRCR